MFNSEKNLFFSFLSFIAKDFKNILNNKNYKKYYIISHFDTDGITSCALFNQFLKDNKIEAEIIFLPFLYQNILSGLDDKSENMFFFLDLGSNNVKNISDSFTKSKVYIFDHHNYNTEFKASNIIIINPFNFFKESSFDLSACGVVFYFLREIDIVYEKYAYLAVLSSVGEKQSDKEFANLTKEIFNIAVKDSQIYSKKELNIPNDFNKYLPKALSNKNNLFLSQYISSFSKAFKILDKSMVNYRLKNGFKTYTELTKKEKDKLILTLESEFKLNEEQDLFCDRLMVDKKTGLFLNYDLSENSTILNAFGKEGLAGKGLEYLEGKLSIEEVEDILTKYKNDLYSYILKIKNKDLGLKIYSGKNYIMIDLKKEVHFNFTGVIASIISHSSFFQNKKFILVIGNDYENNLIKISLRVSKKDSDFDSDLTKVLQLIVGDIDWVGGHKKAAGAVIDSADLDLLLKKARKTFSKL
jgi:single-stranded DNA-specific DHH superfamily exonuclease